MSSCAIGYDAPPIKALRVPPGWTANEEGYFITPEAMTLAVEALYTQAAELDIWEQAYYKALEDHQNTIYKIGMENSQLHDKLSEALDSHKTVISQYEKALKKEKLRGKSPGIGLFAGPSFTLDGKFEISIGVGLVWRW